MEFHEKLQQLRKKQGLTQEQLAEKLYVSRTAVSKWESGRGYPSIDSLRCISRVFEISIDDLLSGEELMEAAEAENNENLRRVYASASGVPDLCALALILLPLYGNPDGSLIRSVNLLSFTAASPLTRTFYWILLCALISAGLAQIFLVRSGKDAPAVLARKISLFLSTVSILFFAAAKEPYALSILFLLFLGKLFLYIRQEKMR